MFQNGPRQLWMTARSPSVSRRLSKLLLRSFYHVPKITKPHDVVRHSQERHGNCPRFPHLPGTTRK